MKSRSGTGHWIWAICALLALSLTIAACGGGDDDDVTPTAEAAAATETPAAISQETPTTASDPTPTVEATATLQAPTATAQPATPTQAQAAATATSPATATPTGTVEEDLLADIEMLDPELLPNFTLVMRIEMRGVPGELEDMDEDAIFDLEIEQSALDNYHMRFNSADMVIEIWSVDGMTYITEDDGSIVSLPGSDMGFFSPSLFLQTVPPLDSELQARRTGEETVSGRQTTRYEVSAENYLALSELFEDGMVPDDADGELVLWVDNELNIPIRYDADITWTNTDGTDGVLLMNYLISDIGSTPRVEAPQ
jgi:hypothetical protein